MYTHRFTSFESVTDFVKSAIFAKKNAPKVKGITLGAKFSTIIWLATQKVLDNNMA
jgi:hypothetical protein